MAIHAPCRVLLLAMMLLCYAMRRCRAISLLSTPPLDASRAVSYRYRCYATGYAYATITAVTIYTAVAQAVRHIMEQWHRMILIFATSHCHAAMRRRADCLLRRYATLIDARAQRHAAPAMLTLRHCRVAVSVAASVYAFAAPFERAYAALLAAIAKMLMMLTPRRRYALMPLSRLMPVRRACALSRDAATPVAAAAMLPCCHDDVSCACYADTRRADAASADAAADYSR